MTRRHWGWIVVLALGVAAAVAVWVILREPETEESLEAWPDDVQFEVRLVHGDRTYDIELTDFPGVTGWVVYEGPAMVEGEENWKEPHEYRGVDLRAVVESVIGMEVVETLTPVALDGWHKTLPAAVLDGDTPCGTVLLALSVDGEPPQEWEDAPALVFLPADERFGNADMLDALGSEYAHYYGQQPSTTGMQVKGVVFLVVNYDGGALPTLADL